MKALEIFKDKQVRATVIAIGVPVALQNLITYLTSMLDTLMVGQLGEIQLSATSVSNQFALIFMGITFGICSGTNVLLAQYWGKGDKEAMRNILAIMYWCTLVLSVIFCVAGVFFPSQIIRIFTPDAEVIAEGSKYMALAAFSYMGIGISNIIFMTLRSVGTVKISVITYLISLFANSILNYVLIFGKFGAPALGVQGAAIATVVARAIEATIAVVYMFKFENKIGIRLKDMLKFDKSYVTDLRISVLPVVFNETIWSVGSSSMVMVMGHMGRSFVTANSISNMAIQLAMIVTRGVSNALSVIIGNTIGAKDYEKAQKIAEGVVPLSTILGCIGAVIVYAIRPIIVGFYNIPPESKEIVMIVMGVGAVMFIFQTVAMLEFIGVLRGGGDAHFVLVADVIFMWILAIPLGYLAGLVFNAPVGVVYFLLKIDEVVKIMAGTWRIYSKKWIKNLTR